MRKIIALGMLLASVCSGFSQSVVYEYKLFSTVESVVPGGFGRSRVITTDKEKQVVEADLENFFSLVGINFKNIANNDLVIAAKINEFAKDGWQLDQTVTGVYGADKSTGIFITRYIFKRPLK
jgi:hypothetical protein